VSHGDALVAQVYNAVRSGPHWPNTLLIVTYDEHGGLYDHVIPPSAAIPDDNWRDGFKFDRFGVRVPAVIVSPFIKAGSVIRPPGDTPFDHTSIIATLRALFHFEPLTKRDAAAPDLLGALDQAERTDCPPSIEVNETSGSAERLVEAAAMAPNGLQQALAQVAEALPPLGADLEQHVAGLVANAVSRVVSVHGTVEGAAAAAKAGLRSFLGRV
jgi:phospholipase C